MNQFLNAVVKHLEGGLNLLDFHWIVRQLIAAAESALPGGTPDEKKAWVKATGRVLIEQFDNKIPVLGAFADLPPVDLVESWAWNIAVDWVWAQLVKEGLMSGAITTSDVSSGNLSKVVLGQPQPTQTQGGSNGTEKPVQERP